MPERSDEELAKTTGKGDKGTAGKAKKAAERTLDQRQPLVVPVNPDGKPLVKISMAASELIPTGQYANVSVGPAHVEAYIDPDDEQSFGQEQIDNIAKAINTLAEIVEVDVVAVQRSIVLESLQENVSTK